MKARDDAAWRRLVSVYGRLVLYWCRRTGILREDCVDICQDVFRAVAVNIDGFRRDQASGSFRGWLCTIMRSKIVDHFRRQNRQPTAPGGSEAQERLLEIPNGDASSVVEASDQEKAILVALDPGTDPPGVRARAHGKHSGGQPSRTKVPLWLRNRWA